MKTTTTKKTTIETSETTTPEAETLPPFSLAETAAGVRFLRSEAFARGRRYLATIFFPATPALLGFSVRLLRKEIDGDDVRFRGEAATLLAAGSILRAAFSAETTKAR